MKTETERLRESAEAQFRKERFEELQAYIDDLYATMDTCWKASNRHFKLELIALFTWCITLITVGDGLLETLAWFIWVGLAVVDWLYYQPKVISSLARLSSCFETLRILGLIDQNDIDKDNQKLRKYGDNPIEQLWAKIKRQKQEEVYGTA